MELFIFWFSFAVLVGFYANSKGRSGFGYFFLSIILSPLIGIIAVVIAGENTQELDHQKTEYGEFKKCPYCAELIKGEAVVCRYCNRDLPKQEKTEVKTEANTMGY